MSITKTKNAIPKQLWGGPKIPYRFSEVASASPLILSHSAGQSGGWVLVTCVENWHFMLILSQSCLNRMWNG